MTTQYLVRKVQICPVCHGERTIINADWQRINQGNSEWMEARGIKTFTDEAVDDWNRRIKEQWPYGDPPPEEEICGECEGNGVIESQVSLADAPRDLGVMTGLAVQELV